MRKSPKDITVLIVDDEVQLCESLEMGLELEDFNVLTAFNGVEGLKMIQDNPQIDFVLTDIKMPEMDGIGLLDEIIKRKPNIPIVCFVSGYAEIEKEKLIEKGALDIIPKPYDMDEIIEIILKNVS